MAGTVRNILACLLFLAPAAAQAQPVPLRAELVAEGLELPVFATSPAGDPRLFIVEQTGRIRILSDGALAAGPFLDLSGVVSGGNEQGLLGLAFHPDYATNGRFFVDFTDTDGDTRVVGYTVSADPGRADAGSGTPLLAIDQPFANHNGGWIGFGPDGYLYIGTGDGGAGGDPGNRAQNPQSLLGKLLRIDVDSARPYAIPSGNPYANGGGAPEVYMLGLRNPWRIAFDRDQLYIADVGQNAWEEINALPYDEAGANLGWRVLEANACFNPQQGCDPSGFVAPTYAYSHESGGCSVTGGYVYRGKAIPEIEGLYLFSDFCAGFLRALDPATGEVSDWSAALGGLGNVTSFGQDAAGELYLATIEGNLYRIARAN